MLQRLQFKTAAGVMPQPLPIVKTLKKSILLVIRKILMMGRHLLSNMDLYLEEKLVIILEAAAYLVVGSADHLQSVSLKLFNF